MKKWATIGQGFISERHMKGIQDIGDRIIATVDIDPEKNALMGSFEELLASTVFNDVDNVAICTPNDTHVDMALECVKRGKKVLVEKPVGISSKEIEKLPNDGSVLTVHQLRYHPEIVRRVGINATTVLLDIAVPRGKSYWGGWKGDTKRSGGILLNIGIHYLDILIYLFGNEYTVDPIMNTKDRASGRIQFTNGPLVEYGITILPEKMKGWRNITIDQEEIELSNSDNLSYDDLHKHVYADFQRGVGILPKEAIKAVRLAEQL